MSAWAYALWNFRLPLLERTRESFGRTLIYCPDREYYVKDTGHVKRLRDAGFEVMDGPVSAGLDRAVPAQVAALYRLLKRERFDVLMAHQPMGALVGITAGWLAGVPVRIYSTGGLKHVPGKKGLSNLAMRYGEAAVIRMSDAVFLVNREDEELLGRNPSTRARAVYVGPRGGCGIDTGLFNPALRSRYRAAARAEHGLADDVFVVGYSGRCVWEKGFREMVGAARLLERTPGARFVFLILGDGKDMDGIRAEVEEGGLSHRFVFAGYRFELERHLAALDAFMLPSYREGLPTALMEAMAMGIPCIATDVRGSRELVTDAETGLLMPPGSAEGLAEAVRRMTADQDAAATMGRRGSERVFERYSEQALIGRTMEIIEGLVEARAGG